MTHEQRLQLAQSFLSASASDDAVVSELTEIEEVSVNTDKLAVKAKRGSRVAAIKRQQKFISTEVNDYNGI